MIDKRLGDHLWVEWTGVGHEGFDCYYTPEHVDLEEEIVRRALASMLQKDGIVDSLFEGFETIAQGEVIMGWIGIVDEEPEYTVCEEDGTTFSGHTASDVKPATWVKLDY